MTRCETGMIVVRGVLPWPFREIASMKSSSPSTFDTTSLITATASNEVVLVQEVVDRVIDLAGRGEGDRADSHTLIGFRSVAPDLAALLARTIDDAFAEAEAQDMRVVTADISGVMRIEEGWRCWGFVGVVPTTVVTRQPVVLDRPSVQREGRVITVTVSIRFEEGTA